MEALASPYVAWTVAFMLLCTTVTFAPLPVWRKAEFKSGYTQTCVAIPGKQRSAYANTL